MNVRNTLSTILLIGAAVLFAVAGWLWYQDRQKNEALPTPEIIAGQAELKNVVDDLRASGLTVDYGQQAISSDFLIPPGQALIVNGDPLYVFLFDSPQDRQEQLGNLDPEELPLSNGFGTPVPVADVHIAQGSNVLTVLISNDQATIDSVTQVVEAIP